jgi:hypothetical protein
MLGLLYLSADLNNNSIPFLESSKSKHYKKRVKIDPFFVYVALHKRV